MRSNTRLNQAIGPVTAFAPLQGPRRSRSRVSRNVKQKHVEMNLKEQLATVGFFIRRAVLNATQRIRLLDDLALEKPSTGRRTNGAQTYAVRNLLWDRPGLSRALDEVGAGDSAAEPQANPASPINAIFFDKL